MQLRYGGILLVRDLENSPPITEEEIQEIKIADWQKESIKCTAGVVPEYWVKQEGETTVRDVKTIFCFKGYLDRHDHELMRVYADGMLVDDESVVARNEYIVGHLLGFVFVEYFNAGLIHHEHVRRALGMDFVEPETYELRKDYSFKNRKNGQSDGIWEDGEVYVKVVRKTVEETTAANTQKRKSSHDGAPPNRKKTHTS